MQRTLIVWCAVGLMIGCLFYVPYGYTTCTVTTTFTPASLAIEPWKMKEHVAWTFVGYQYLFGTPYNSDAKEEAIWKSLDDQHQKHSVDYEDMGIGWHLVFIECATVALIAGALLFTFRPTPKES